MSESEDRAAAAADTDTDPFLEALEGYRDGRASVQAVVAQVRTYRGRRRHLLWDRDRRRGSRGWSGTGTGIGTRPYVYACFELLSSKKMAELVRALVDECPGFPTIRSKRDNGGFRMTFLYVALSLARQKAEAGRSPHEGSTSVQVLELLAVPGTTRLRGGNSDSDYGGDGDGGDCRLMPLHQAAGIPRISPDFLRGLLDLDPGVAAIPDDDENPPLFHATGAAWRATPSSTPIVKRLIQLRPEALYCRRPARRAWNPPETTNLVVDRAFRNAPIGNSAEAEATANLLLAMVRRFPEAVRPDPASASSTQFVSALRIACERFPEHRTLIKALVEVFPPALCYAQEDEEGEVSSSAAAAQRRQRAGSGRGRRSRPLRLPVDAAAGRNSSSPRTVETLRYLREETAHLVLASVEYALACRPDDELFAHPPAARFREAVAGAVAKATGALGTAPSRRRDATVPAATGYALAQGLRRRKGGLGAAGSAFADSETADGLCGPRRDSKLHDAVLGDPVLHLYRLNRSGRSDPSPCHQIRLLASVSGCLDVAYLHFREVSSHLVAAPSVEPSSVGDDPMEL